MNNMAKRFQTMILFCLIFLMSLSCVHIDNTSDLSPASMGASGYTNASVLVESETYQVNRGYSRIEQQDYWSNNNSTRLSTSLFKRSQNTYRNNERNEITIAILDVVSKVVLFSFIMILFATGGTGLSMPFRCLLLYIHSMDGKKRIV